MRTVIAVFIIALGMALVLVFQPAPPRTAWGGCYAHWHPSDSRAEAMWIAYADTPPPMPADSWCPVWNPIWCKSDRPPLRGN